MCSLNKIFHSYSIWFLTLPLFLLGCSVGNKVDLIVHNATIYSVDEQFSVHQAMAIDSGRIVAIGPEHEILNAYTADKKVDAQKRAVYPGFIDAHCHFLYYGLIKRQVDLLGTTSYEDVIDRVQAYASSYPGEWIEGRGWDHTDWETNEYPDRAALDSLFPDRPVLIRRIGGHAALANGKALEMAGLTPSSKINGGQIEVKDGRLTGILVDQAYEKVAELIPAPGKPEKTEALINTQKECFAYGLTSISDAGLDHVDIELIQSLNESGELKIGIYAMISDKEDNFEVYLKKGPVKTPYLNVCSFKFYCDGALGSRGACLIKPYSDVTDRVHHGTVIRDRDYYLRRAEELYDLGFQMNTHCIGDSATRLMLDVYESVLKGQSDRRWRIEHAQIYHPEDLQRFAELAIIPSVQPTHATSDMYWAAERLGESRMPYAYAYKTLLEQNKLIALGTDFPVEGISPLHTFYSAVFRKDTANYPPKGFQIENALTREQALKGMTIWAALANFEEQEKGSLQVGKYADFIILDRDIMKIPEEMILKTEVIGTYVKGEEVYSR